MKSKRMRKVFVLFSALFLGLVSVVYAADNIDSSNGWAWAGNAGWLNFSPNHGGVTVYDDHLEGYAWAENIGWVRLGTYTGGGAYTYANDAAGNYGVNRATDGKLDGYAWSANAGWINFNPDDGQVTIDPTTGEFDGYAWGENVGWIHFKSTGTYAYGVALGKVYLHLPIIIKN